ncbi:MAG TPA: Uma2 family endonuclease [Tepidisphaeraceae bacterium]|nr:Uma2 family endonuclease [Tepidisphaeraceae bacterium]
MTLQATEPRSRHWTLAEYYQLAEEGWFEGQRVQLIEGEIIQMPPQGHAHALCLSRVSRWLYETFNREYVIRVQMPLNALKDSDPEPDAAVLRGPDEQYRNHPRSALFVVEIADSSLRLDRRKAGIYAAAGVPEYWIVNLAERCIEVYRSAETSGKSSYPSPIVINENQTISTLAFPEANVKVAVLLP